MILRTRVSFLLGLIAASMSGATAVAVPYASAVRNTSGSTYEFVLNESADSVTIRRDGGNEITINAPAAGRHTFDLGAFSDFEIEVGKSAPGEWTEISDQSNLFTNFERPQGMAVNTDPTSPFFGTVYVNNSTTLSTLSGRSMGDGVYALTANLQGVDLTTFNEVTDPNDTSQAKAPGWTVTGSSNSAHRMTLDGGNNLIVSDWSDANGGVKYASPDLTTGGLVLATEAGPTGGVDSSVSDEFGPIPLHGSIVSKPTVTGTLGVDLTLWAIDEDLDVDLSVPGDDGNSLWRWDVGSATEYDINPTLVIDSGSIDLRTDPEEDLDQYFNLNIGVLADAHYEERFGKWYLTQSRNDGTQSSLVIVTADGVDGRSPTVEWASKQFSRDNDLDGFTSDDPEEMADDGLQDIFRSVGTVAFSADGTKMFAHRAQVFGLTAANDNPVLGLNSNLPGSILVIPLDENGLPDIEIDDNGTPEDTSDDFLSNVESIEIESPTARHTRHETKLDAAGNLYITNNISELLQVFSPGGDSCAVTTSGGGFSVSESTCGVVPDDYNGDGKWDALDYALWRDTLGSTTDLRADGNGNGVIDAGDYDVWQGLYGTTSAESASAAPEPAAIVLVGVLGGALGALSRRRR